ncbi:MAG: class I SAM-dependent methyltransferase [Clostridium sp.]|nr:class I SAM-dependent methyltransferase [Clostridium sp.]
MTQEEIQFFDRLAPEWDSREILSTPEKVRDITDRFGIEEGMRVLDLGTGTGVLLSELCRRVGRDGQVVAVDASPGMLAEARRKSSSLSNLRLLERDFESETIGCGRFDVAILYCVYPHLHEPRQTFERLFRESLTEHGVIYVAFPTDEQFINNIHRTNRAPGDFLPSAPRLAERFESWGLIASCPREGGDYVVAVRRTLRSL